MFARYAQVLCVQCVVCGDIEESSGSNLGEDMKLYFSNILHRIHFTPQRTIFMFDHNSSFLTRNQQNVLCCVKRMQRYQNLRFQFIYQHKSTTL